MYKLSLKRDNRLIKIYLLKVDRRPKKRTNEKGLRTLHWCIFKITLDTKVKHVTKYCRKLNGKNCIFDWYFQKQVTATKV